MLHILAQKRLKSRGFSSGKKRRTTKDTPLAAMMRSGWQVCAGIFVLFTLAVSAWIVLASAEDSIFSDNGLQTAVVVMAITATLCVHWHVSQPTTFKKNGRVTLMLSVILIQLVLIKLSTVIAAKLAPNGGFELIILPFVFAPMVISLMIERQHGTFAVVYSSLYGGMMVPSRSAFLFVIFSILCGFVAIYLTNRVRKRSRLMTAGIFAGLACAILAFAVGQIHLPFLTENEDATWALAGQQAIMAIVVSALTAIVVSGMLPLIEGVFRVTTDVSWIEWADLNHPLLKKMTIEAPGTYHHSLVVATLAETAAEAVGANAVMARVCAYFHDIGKMNKPEYFVENIGDRPNPHDDLTPTMSSLIVMAHVKDGVDLAIKHKLKREMIDVIKEHHGKSLVKYFYHRALEHQQEIRDLVADNKAREEDIPEVKEESFRYSGPLPKSRESAIISLADAVESASRSLKKPTPNKIEELIDEIFKDRLLDGQLDRAQLTFDDLKKIKKSFNTTIRSMMHNRIEYPNLDKDKDKEKDKKASAKEEAAEAASGDNAAEKKAKAVDESAKPAAKKEDSESAKADTKEGGTDEPAKPAKKKGKAGDQSQKILARIKAEEEGTSLVPKSESDTPADPDKRS